MRKVIVDEKCMTFTSEHNYGSILYLKNHKT